MTWVYLDDGFPEHPKVIRAGGDAAWLAVCGLAYCNRQLTNGRIPKEQVSRLSDRKQPAKLAAKLVTEGIWIDQGDHYEVHDYDQWQSGAVQQAEKQAQGAVRRRERARRAANTKWHGNPEGAPPPDDAYAPSEHDGSIDQAEPEQPDEQCVSNADGNAPLTPHAFPAVVDPPHQQPVVAAPSPKSGGEETPKTANGNNPDWRVEAAVGLLAEAEASTVEPHGPGLVTTIANRTRTEKGPELARLAARDPDATPAGLALLITSATARNAWEREHRCHRCRQTGWIDAPDPADGVVACECTKR